MNLVIKSFEGRKLQALKRNGEYWFFAKDVCDILELLNTSATVKSVCKKPGINSIYISSNNQRRKVLCINEPNLYRLIFKSRKPFAEKFQDWIFEEVLPELRRTGSYKKDTDDKKSDQNHTRIRNESKPVRMKFAEKLLEYGCKKPYHFINISKKMKVPLGITVKKDEMSTVELLKIMASETIAIAKMLQEKPKGYYECLPICVKSSEEIENILANKKVTYENKQ